MIWCLLLVEAVCFESVDRRTESLRPRRYTLKCTANLDGRISFSSKIQQPVVKNSLLKAVLFCHSSPNNTRTAAL